MPNKNLRANSESDFSISSMKITGGTLSLTFLSLSLSQAGVNINL